MTIQQQGHNDYRGDRDLDQSKNLTHDEKSTKNPSKQGHYPLRDRMSEELYQKVLNQPQRLKQSPRHYYRFKLFLIISRHTGLRVGKIGNFKKEDIDNLMKNAGFLVKEKKTGKYRTVPVPDQCLQELKEIQDGINIVFEKQETLSGTPYVKNWTRFINTCLKRSINDSDLYIRSHSMRISYITDLLEHFPLIQVRNIVSHSSVTTTERYDRYIIDVEKLKDSLEKRK